MAAFFPEVLDAFLLPDFLEDVRTKFHYGDTKTAAFQAVAQEMLPLMRGEAFWESRAFSGKKRHPGECADAVYESVIMSLGGGLDALQERYSKEGRLSESYMLEVLASELLLKGYGAYNRYVRENRDRHVARYHFLGSDEAFPLELLPELLQESVGQIVCNTAFCLVPKKSVVFVSELTQDSKVQCESICVGCHNLHCPNRAEDDSPRGRMLAKMADIPLSYGYSRIFGRF
ncbi:MAG: hypothetical protein HDR05_02595 [Lachnospiraceae bacterium]|nr:hypothetical protein [Lachnospiraceae bacterium]